MLNACLRRYSIFLGLGPSHHSTITPIPLAYCLLLNLCRTVFTNIWVSATKLRNIPLTKTWWITEWRSKSVTFSVEIEMWLPSAHFWRKLLAPPTAQIVFSLKFLVCLFHYCSFGFGCRLLPWMRFVCLRLYKTRGAEIDRYVYKACSYVAPHCTMQTNICKYKGVCHPCQILILSVPFFGAIESAAESIHNIAFNYNYQYRYTSTIVCIWMKS